jgi:hypothetical protein
MFPANGPRRSTRAKPGEQVNARTSQRQLQRPKSGRTICSALVLSKRSKGMPVRPSRGLPRRFWRVPARVPMPLFRFAGRVPHADGGYVKHYCPMCGEQWDDNRCGVCGWSEPKSMSAALDAVADTVLKYRPKARSKPAIQRKRRRTILEKKETEADDAYFKFGARYPGQ